MPFRGPGAAAAAGIRRLTAIATNLLRRRRVEQSVDDELRAALALLVEDKLRAGLDVAEARRRAAAELGSLESIKDAVRDVRSGAFLARAGRDLRHAVRALRKTPAAALLIVATFGIGTGGVTTMFGLVDAILLQPLPYPEAERIVAVRHSAPGLGLPETGLPAGTYLRYRDLASSFESLAIYEQRTLNLATPGAVTERVEVTLAGPELFEVLGTTSALGRLFTDADGRPGFMNTTWPVPVLLSHDLWARRFGSDRSIVGRTITLNERARLVVGVLPAGFGFPRPETQVWMLFMPSESNATVAGSFEYEAVGRLRPDVNAAAAGLELARILASIAPATPEAAARLQEARLVPIVLPLKEALTRDVAVYLWLLLGGAAFFVLAACANAGTLSVLRAERRERELAVRAALGAGRGDLLRLFVIEAALLSAAGVSVALLATHVALRSIVVFAPVQLPRIAEAHLDGRVIAFATSLALGLAVFIGVATFLRQARVMRVPMAPDRLSGIDRGRRRRDRHVLVGVQVALTLTLLAASALMAQSVRRLTAVDPGFDPSGLLTVEISIPGNLASRHQQIYSGVLSAVRGLPGVEDAAAASVLPLDDRVQDAFPMLLGTPAQPSGEPIAMKFVTPRYFEVMRTRIASGAGLVAAGRAGVPSPVVVSAALARRFFPGEDAVGETVRRLEANGRIVEIFDRAAGRAMQAPAWTIVGVAEDVREDSLRGQPAEMVYVPVRDPAVELSIVPTNMTLVVRHGGPPATLASALRESIRRTDPRISVARIRAMDALVARSTARERFLAALLVAAAVASLLLGVIGVYGVAAQAVRRREQEIGVRLAIGAQPSHVMRMVLAESAAAVLAGAAIGIGGALAVGGALRSFLFEVSPNDPGTVAAVTTLMILAALAATLLPLRRAIGLDPVTALRRG